MSERERFFEWAVSDERGDDHIEALSWSGSHVNRNRHAMTGWIGRSRIAEQEKAELVEALRRMNTLNDRMMKECNLGASALSVETIREMNEAPIQAQKALATHEHNEGEL